MDENLKKQLESLAKRVEEAESNVNAAKNIISKIHEDYLRVDYTQIEGETGKFNGFEMITDAGKKFKVNDNYAAKSKLVYGDVLKLIDEDGKNIYKQIEKVDKKRVEGILTKKEGEWYLLTDRGSHKVSDAAAEYHKAELNSQAVAYLPADNLDAPFATLDTVETPHVVKKEDKKEEKKEQDIKDMNKKEMDLKTKNNKKEKEPAKSAAKKSTKKKTAPKSAPKSKKGPTKKSTRTNTAKKATDSTKPTTKSKEVITDDDLV